ncbi:uncharacterized protein AMSG_02377 [Thecamonas trahens ATCC 50062]|uniref:Uncharacterized protein n=1 Tax=Thecamonas trahens ATCC 50062 TaxID=461836 RepID=A0A0L0DWE6_THETB|nr:hypothetical protein AMSG_02377 [Thecamonas trahens ATCC 50062]KNC56406.1 hypothetical protein AMSG_02377 [Thecamonas trahens ATCC 50062]|eukprot:XP_013760919.1 hypothetical protein AMSG_02377 [Thecamonas trahens ATCC 50062]
MGSFVWGAALVLALVALGVVQSAAGANTCDDLHLLAGSTVFVLASGGSTSASKDATRTEPVDLVTAMAIAVDCATASQPLTLALHVGTYSLSSALVLASHTTLDGGYTYAGAGMWSKSNSAATVLHRTGASYTINAPDQGAYIAVEAVSKTDWRLQDLTVVTDDAPATSGFRGVSSYGLYIRNSIDYQIVRCSIVPGAASSGKAGDAGLAQMAATTMAAFPDTAAMAAKEAKVAGAEV